MSHYDPTGPLPLRTVVLEASAGTGKTHAIAALATRYLAEGVVTAENLAVISFSRIASAELRSRVRERLRTTHDLLRDSLDGREVVSADETVGLLLAAPRGELQERVGRLRRALSTLDAASIMTIHEFCQAMLHELGVLADQDPQASLVENLTPLVDQVVEDLYLARYAASPAGPPFVLKTAQELGRAAVDRCDADLVPRVLGGAALERLAFAEAVRVEVAHRKRWMGVYSFDDQLLRLRDALRQASAEVGGARLRRRCQVVLVDEFQDTDPVQWEILRDTFHGQVPLVLIGDPKQAIYAFRGADVTAYTDAVATAGVRFSLAVNHRADAGVVKGIAGLFHNVNLGPGIEVPAVTASHLESRLVAPAGVPWTAPVRLRCVAPASPLDAVSARQWITADVVSEVVNLLSGCVELLDGGPRRAVRPDDIAILVSTNARGRDLADALTAAGVSVAFSGSDSIFGSAAARDWQVLLQALEQPRGDAIRAATLTDFLGGNLASLAQADDNKLAEVAATIHRWSRVLLGQGVAALFADLQSYADAQGRDFPARLLRRPRGERDLTDYRHLAELLHAKHLEGLRGQALVAWLNDAIEKGEGTGERIRRLETDRDAVQIMTVHKAKGLQFPIVLVPQAADLRRWEDEGQALVFHSEGRRVLDLGGSSAPGRLQRTVAHQREAAGDRLRSLYVAATRAQSQLTLWWARTGRNTESSPLHRLVFRDHARGGVPEDCYPVDALPGSGHPRDVGWLADAGISVEEAPAPSPARMPSAAGTAGELRLPPWHRVIDRSWRRTSYSGLTEAVHGAAPTALMAGSAVDDEPSGDDSFSQATVGAASPMAGLPGGTTFGSLVHRVFESVDWHAPEEADEAALARRLLAAAEDGLRRFQVAGVTPGALAQALLPSLLTPLGRLTNGRALADIAVADRLSELDFEFPLGNADSVTTVGDLASLLANWLEPRDPLAGYPTELAGPKLAGQVLRGFLTGSIDSVLRLRTPSGPRFVVVDYKTNRLGPPEQLTLGHYTKPAMAAEMMRTHYPLQALLYCVALHRFLGQRLPGYDPTRHLGGAGYLFVRGMAGRPGEAADPLGEPDTGVFTWFPPAGLVCAASDLLADRSAS
ncbi:MAG: UvrD-helicase domain-containing protein [Propionicimonas sp.]